MRESTSRGGEAPALAARRGEPSRISVIVPVYNGRAFLDRCLQAVARSSLRPEEIIVVDDASTDDSADIARRRGASVLQMSRQSGPGAARNHGARSARGEVLFFVDADVVIRPDAVERAATALARDAGLAAVFGSYDDEPAEGSFVSQYKNLSHHFIHQRSRPEATTFWAGCGAIRRDVFAALGGFDAARYPRPSIEDIELGYRMNRAGHRIRLDRDLQGTHLKRWSLASLLRADILHRAVPWSRLILERGAIPNDLNLCTADRFSAGLVCLAVALAVASPFWPWLLLGTLSLVGGVLVLNREAFAFFLRRRGLWFAVRAFLMQLVYYLYSAATFAVCWGQARLGATPPPAGTRPWPSATFGSPDPGSLPRGARETPGEPPSRQQP
jgi:glycosyltransferase involved in cell wall biosynthesis